MIALLAGVAVILALPTIAMAANLALHWPRAQPRRSGNRRLAPLLTPRALIDEAIATLLVCAGPVALLLPAPRPRCRRDEAILVVLRDPYLPPNAHWLLVRRLRRAGWQVASGTFQGRPHDGESVDRIADRIRSRVGDSRPVTLIGIGAGGLLARQVAARQAQFARIATLSTPHQGSLARAVPAPCRPQSPYLTALEAMDRRPRRFDAIAIYSDGDAWIEPAQAAYLPGAFNLEVHGIGHLAMLFSPRVFAYLEESLTAALPEGLER